jgi:hypothetical protein
VDQVLGFIDDLSQTLRFPSFSQNATSTMPMHVIQLFPLFELSTDSQRSSQQQALAFLTFKRLLL